MILGFDATTWYALGAVLAGVGSLLGGIAAIWVAKKKAHEKDPPVPPDGG
jgi:hypothetical protein